MALIDPRVLAQLQAGGQIPIGSGGAQIPLAGIGSGPSGIGAAPTIARQYVQNQPFGALPASSVPAIGPAPVYATTAPSPLNADLYARTRAATGAAQPVNTGTDFLPEAPTFLESGAGGAASTLGGAGAGVAEDVAPGVLARILAAGPSGLKGALAGGEGGLADIGISGLAKGALGGFGGVAIPSIVGNLAGNAIGGKTGRVVSDASTGLGLGGAAAGLGTVLGIEALGGPVGWGLAGLTAAGGGLYALLTHGHDDKSDAHAAYQTGWKKIDSYADDLGILNGNVISGAKDAYNAALQASKDPTDKATQKAALAQVQQSLQQYQVQRAAQDSDQQNLLALQAFGQKALAPYLGESDRTSQAAQAAYGQLAAAAPNPQARALANATGAGFQADNAASKAAYAAQVNAAPYEYQQQQSLINQYQQQIAAAALAKGQTSGL